MYFPKPQPGTLNQLNESLNSKLRSLHQEGLEGAASPVEPAIPLKALVPRLQVG